MSPVFEPPQVSCDICGADHSVFDSHECEVEDSFEARKFRRNL